MLLGSGWLVMGTAVAAMQATVMPNVLQDIGQDPVK